MALALILIPALAAGLAAVIRSNRLRPLILPPIAAAHLLLSLFAVSRPQLATFTRWLELDPPGRIVLLVLSILFLICSIYSVGYLHYRRELSNRVDRANQKENAQD